METLMVKKSDEYANPCLTYSWLGQVGLFIALAYNHEKDNVRTKNTEAVHKQSSNTWPLFPLKFQITWNF